MEEIVITTDSGLNPLDTNNMVPGIIRNVKTGEEFYDTIKYNKDDNIKEIDAKEIIELRSKGERFKTAAPTFLDYKSLFTNLVDEKKKVLHLCMSSGISSGSCNNPLAVLNTLDEIYQDNVTLVDTLTAGSGGSVIVKYAKDLVKEGLDINTIKEKIESIKNKIFSSYYIADMKGYRESGRVPFGTVLLDMLSIRYRVDINKDGALHPNGFKRGSVEKSVKRYIKDIINEENIEQYNPNYLVLLKMPLIKICIEEIIAYIESFNYFKSIDVGDFMGTISAYGVNDQIGIGLIKK